MNKIVLKDNSYEIIKSDDKIEFVINEEYINKIKFIVNGNTKLELVYDNLSEMKYDISFEIKENIKLEFIDIKKNNKVKSLYKYTLKKNSILNIIKVCDILSINERNIINLNGENSKLYCLLKTVCKSVEKYDFVINHNSKNTISDIITNGVNISGNLYFNVTTYIPNGSSGSIANQNNRIINLVDNECLIRPNLLIDEYDVSANHSALIGNFKDEEFFYIQRLGLDLNSAKKLLIKGFLKNKLNDKLSSNFKKYWR